MPLYLTIDRGNTEAKITLWDGTILVDSMICRDVTAAVLRDFIDGRDVVAAIYCTVARDSDRLPEALGEVVPRVLKLDHSMPLPIKIGYATPSTLGTDRIAAAAGAWCDRPGSPVLVVDAGTAVTYDYVGADGVFHGGNIAPGISMQLEALHRYTARLPRVPYPEHPLRDFGERYMGWDTHSAITLGALYGIVGAIDYYRRRLGADTRVVLGGGCAHTVAPLCTFPAEVDEHLASKGLNRILLYNENK